MAHTTKMLRQEHVVNLAGIVCPHLNQLLLDVKPPHKKTYVHSLAFDVNKTLHGFFLESFEWCVVKAKLGVNKLL